MYPKSCLCGPPAHLSRHARPPETSFLSVWPVTTALPSSSVPASLALVTASSHCPQEALSVPRLGPQCVNTTVCIVSSTRHLPNGATRSPSSGLRLFISKAQHLPTRHLERGGLPNVCETKERGGHSRSGNPSCPDGTQLILLK